MEVIEPARLKNLGGFVLDIEKHAVYGEAPGIISVSNLYGFTTIADLKRQIWLLHAGDPEWGPNRVWIAQRVGEDLYQPLDMTWGPQTTLENGLASPFTNLGVPDTRLVDATGKRKSVYPTLNEGILLESLFADTRPVIAIWNIDGIVRGLGVKLRDVGVLKGYIQMYFPKIQEIEHIMEAADESFATTQAYIQQRITRVGVVDELLKDAKVVSSDPFRLFQMRRWKLILPALSADPKSLDIMFYEFNTSRAVPFLRLFPANGREPLLKLATGPSGFPVIHDKDMLSYFLEEEPERSGSAVLIAKIPFESLAYEVRATHNVALTIYWFEDGSSSVVLEAPRKDMPLDVETVAEAGQILKKALQSLGYPADIEPSLDELSAIYRMEYTETKLTQKKIFDRIEYFSPFLDKAPYQEQTTTKVFLKWKAVNNYEHEGVVFSYLTKRVLDDDVESTLDVAERTAMFVAGIMETFGRNEADAKALFGDWYRRRTEIVPTGGEPVLAHNSGVDIEITLSHPIYLISFTGIDSKITFNRVVSVMTAFFYYTPAGVPIEAVLEAPTPPIVNVAVRPQAAAAAQPDARWLALLGANNDDSDDDDESDDESGPKEEAAVPAAPEAAPIDGKHLTLEPLKEWWKAQLDRYDKKLFGYSQVGSVTVYSRTCQTSSGRLPNVMAGDQLDKLIKEYGAAVEWVFLPPPDNIILDVEKLETDDLHKEMLKRGLDDYFTIKTVTKKGVTTTVHKAKHKVKEMQAALVNLLCLEPGKQGQFSRILRDWKKAGEKEKRKLKPIWFVARAGSDAAKPNYFICAEYWCISDMKPLIPSEFEGTKTRSDQQKEANSCPFCGGKQIIDLKKPAQGQTVVFRKGKAGGEIHELAGYMDNFHPSGFALPCCFTRPTVGQIKPAAGTVPLPKDVLAGAEELAPPPEPEADDDVAAPETKDAQEDYDLTKVLRAIRTQFVLGYEKKKLGPGRIGLCPAALDTMLGQVGSQSVKREGGVAQHLNPKTARAFLRFGLGNNRATPGLNFLELLGFYFGNLQKAGKAQMKGAKLDLPAVLTPPAVIKHLFAEEPPLPAPGDATMQAEYKLWEKSDNAKFLFNFRRAFERANYGNLVHEFAGSASELSDAELATFARQQGFNLAKDVYMRKHVGRLANAWTNFKNYIIDEKAPKNFKHFENLFACPGVIFPEGLILVFFEGSTDAEGQQSVSIRCSEYGVSQFSQKYKPPMAFVWHDLSNDAYEPLIYIEALEKKTEEEGVKAKAKTQFLVLPTLHPEDAKFPLIHAQVQDSLQNFITQYLSYSEGCGRFSSPAHPWLPDMPSATVPKLSDLLSSRTEDLVPNAVLRDRSNRLVGVIYKITETYIYIPAVEDGSMALKLQSVYDIEGLPTPSLDTILTVLSNKGLKKFPGLVPADLLFDAKEQRFCALRLTSGALVPVAPQPIATPSAHPTFTQLMKKGAQPVAILPWTEDARFLGMSQSSSETIDIVPEAVVEEAYQYLRISLSEWLKSSDRDAVKVMKQIKALRKSHLPLYELRRRCDILLESLIHNWLDASDHAEVMPSFSLLRKNCRVERSEEMCSTNPMCSWIGSECKIHTGTSEGIPDIKMYFTGRIIDELLRYPYLAAEILESGVSKIRNPIGLVRQDDFILTGKSKISEISAELGLDYVPEDDYSTGLSYPEDAHDSTLGRPTRPDHIDIPIEWKRIGLYRIPADPRIEDRFIASVVAYTGHPLKAVEKRIKDARPKKNDSAVQWNDSDWWCFGKAYGTDVFIARYNQDTQMTRIFKWYKIAPVSTVFTIVFFIDSPEILQSIPKPIPLANLPSVFKTYMDAGFGTTWESLHPAP